MDDKDKSKEDAEDAPILKDVVFDASLPLQPPRQSPIEEVDHGPDYDPDTLDLFNPVASAEEALRLGAEQVINDLVQEFSAEINSRLREELTLQLHSILDDLSLPPDKT